MTQLEVQLTADIKRLKRQLNNANKELNRFSSKADRASKSTSNITKSTKKSSKSTRNASAAAVEFGRALGDLPYGIQGVANNIQQLTYVIGGGAGLQIAMAAVTSLMVVMGKNGSNLSDILGTLSGTTDRLAKAQRDLAKSSREEIAQSKSEMEILRGLLNVAQDETQSKKSRGRAIAKINDEYGDYLPNLNMENVNTEKVNDAVVKLNKSLIRQAKIRGAQDLIAKQTEKILEAQTKSLLDQANTLDFVNAGFSAVSNTGSASMSLITGGAENAGKTISKANEQIRILRGLLQELLKQDLNLGGIFTSTKSGDAPLPTFAPAIVPNPFKNFIEPDLLSGQAKIAFKNLSKVLAEEGPTIIAPQLSNIEQRFADFKERLATSTLNLASAVSNGFTQLGQSLARGAGMFQSVGAAILAIMGDIATQLGQASIAAGIAGIALKNLFSNPVAAIAAGGALVAIGAALKSAQSAVGGIGNSGVGGGSVGGQGNFNGNSFSGSNVSTSGGFNGRVVFEISGQKLIGVLNNSLSANQRLGGNVSLG